MGLDPGFHRGDENRLDSAGMTGKVTLQSINSEPRRFEPRFVQLIMGDGMRRTFTLVVAIVAIGLALGARSSAWAQDFYKDKTLTIVVGYSPGG
jgi:hypothetical protein